MTRRPMRMFVDYQKAQRLLDRAAGESRQNFQARILSTRIFFTLHNFSRKSFDIKNLRIKWFVQAS